MRTVTVFCYPHNEIGKATLQPDGTAVVEGFPGIVRTQDVQRGMPLCRDGRWIRVPTANGPKFLDAMLEEFGHSTYVWAVESGVTTKGYPEFNPDQPRDDHGQWGSGGGNGNPPGPHGTSSEMQALIEQTRKNGGFTYSVIDGTSPQEGFSVSIKDGSVLSQSEFTPKHITDHVVKNWNLLTQPNNFIGGWLNPENSKVYLDVAHVVKTQAEAEKYAMDTMQIAYYEFKKDGSGKTHPTNWFGLKRVKTMKTTNKVGLTLTSDLSAEALAKLYEKLSGRPVTESELAAMQAALAKKST